MHARHVLVFMRVTVSAPAQISGSSPGEIQNLELSVVHGCWASAATLNAINCVLNGRDQETVTTSDAARATTMQCTAAPGVQT